MFETLIGLMETVNAIKSVFTETPIGLLVLAAFAMPAIIKHRGQIADFLN